LKIKQTKARQEQVKEGKSPTKKDGGANYGSSVSPNLAIKYT